ncbi:MAG: FG-GAP repeat protein, partial [Gammaproteobacteria bacterium]
MLKSVKFFALTGAGALLAVVGLSSGAWAANPPAAEAAAHSTHASQPLPAALRPALYRALAHEAGAAYRINDNGCAELAEQGLKACFDADGAHFTGATPLSLRLVAFGRSGELNPVGAVAPSLHGNRVSYAHGNLTAWWRVLPLGFEQGFTLSRRPAGHGALTLALSASRKDTGASRAATLAWGKLRYGKLVVTDAEGKVVPATLKSEGNHILIAVNDARAVYPLTVDPLVWISQKVAASDGAPGDLFGFSVALSGATALIGAPYATTNGHSGQGVVYVFGKT